MFPQGRGEDAVVQSARTSYKHREWKEKQKAYAGMDTSEPIDTVYKRQHRYPYSSPGSLTEVISSHLLLDQRLLRTDSHYTAR